MKCVLRREARLALRLAQARPWVWAGRTLFLAPGVRRQVKRLTWFTPITSMTWDWS